MRRGAKPAKAKVEAEIPVAKKPLKTEGSRVRDLEKGLVEALDRLQMRNRELVEAQEQQTATAEILRAISGSPTDIQPVFEAIADSAMRLLKGWATAVDRYDG